MLPHERPQRGNVLLRGSIDTGFQLVDPVTRQQIASGLLTLADVVVAARRHGATGIWQEGTTTRPSEDVKHLLWRVPGND